MSAKLPKALVTERTQSERVIHSMIHGQVREIGEECREELDSATQNSNRTSSFLEQSLSLLQLFQLGKYYREEPSAQKIHFLVRGKKFTPQKLNLSV